MSGWGRRGVIASLVVLLAVIGVLPSAAQPPTTVAPIGRTFTRVDLTALAKSPLRPPALRQLARRQTPVSVLIQLDTASVIDQRRSTDRVSRATALKRVAASQDAVWSRLRAVGARPYGRLSTVLNAIQARVRVADLDRIARLPGVRRVQVSQVLRIANTAANRFTGVDRTWTSFGYTGRGQSIAIIDTGIDYTHADFGGPGTPVAFSSNDGARIEPGSFPTAKVTGGYDLVGDVYDPDEYIFSIPQPDPDPLDCNGHGTHVAGTAAGSGVTSTGAPYTGPYTTSALDQDFAVQPGAAPEATIKAYRVFGCAGRNTSDVVVAAIDRAVADGVDVINLSLGSALGTRNGMEQVAVQAATQAGVLVVAAAGNEGAGAYLVANPATADQSLAVAAVDAEAATYPGVTLSGAVAETGLNANGAAIDTPVTAELVDVGLGCTTENYAEAAGKIAVSTRGTCDRAVRATLGQQAGAAAVIMINSSDTLPPYEGSIAGVTLPFVGVRSLVGPALLAAAAAGQQLSLAPTTVANPTYREIADFSSSGPRRGDSVQKPDLAAPGVSIPSAAIGTGRGAAVESGTSMSSPHVAGVAALVRQAHPQWSALEIKSALMSTADPQLIAGYDSARSGTGLVQPLRAAATSTFLSTSSGLNTLAFGVRELGTPYADVQSLALTNKSVRAVTYDLAAVWESSAYGAQLSVSPRSVSVAAGASANVQVTLRVDKAGVAAIPGWRASDAGALLSLRGTVRATPRSAGAEAPALRMSFVFVPVPLSDVRAKQTVTRIHPGRYEDIKLTNHGLHTGTADLYAWLLSDPAGDVGDQDVADVTTVGVQSLPGTVVGAPAEDRLLVFAVGMATASSTQSQHEVDIAIDIDRDSLPDFYTSAVDTGILTGGQPDGTMTAYTADYFAQPVAAWRAAAPANGSTILIPVLASQLGMTPTSGPLLIRAVAGFDVTSDAGDPDLEYDEVPSAARFDPWAPAVSQGNLLSLEPGEFSPIAVRVNQTELTRQGSLGWLVVSPDDAGGAPEADRVRLVLPPVKRVLPTIR